MQTITREIRGIPFFLLVEYLEEMGGKVKEGNVIQGPGWTVVLKKMEPFRLGSIQVGQTHFSMEIEDHLVDGFIETFSKKTLRAGG